MVIKITPKQSKRINTLIKKLCCNYVDGNCLLLDDGEEHACVQCISRYGIYCNYFKNAVLPADKNCLLRLCNRQAESNAKSASHTLCQRQTISATAQAAPPSKAEESRRAPAQETAVLSPGRFQGYSPDE